MLHWKNKEQGSGVGRSMTVCELRYKFLAVLLLLAVWAPQADASEAANPAVSPVAPEVQQQPDPLEQRSTVLEVPPPGTESESSILPLTRDGAILTGLAGNRFIEIAAFAPDIAATFTDEARADFDPRLLGQISTGRVTADTGNLEVSTGSATSSGSASGGADALIQRVQRLNRSLAALNREDNAGVRTNAGSLELQQFLPTGTRLFLTGAAVEESRDGEGVRDTWTIGVSQPLLQGGSKRANLAALRQARNVQAQSEQEFRLNVMDVVRQIEVAYWDLTLAMDVLAIREFGVRLAEEQMRREQELRSVGKALQGDVITAGAERAAREADLADARAAVDSRTIELIRLMRPSDTPRWDLRFTPQDAAEVVEVNPTPAESAALALQARPELMQARLGLENLDLDVLRARNGRLPRLDVVGTYGEGRGTSLLTNTNADDGENYSIGLEFETGLPNRAENARYRRAQLERRRGGSLLAQLEEDIAAEVRQAIVEVRRQWQRVVATSEEVLSREESLRVVQGRRDVGMATNLDVLQVERDFIEARVNDATARVQYVQALTALYMTEGSLLERRGISMASVATRETPLGRPTYDVE